MVSPDAGLIEQLSHSRIYRDYERAFAMATELPLTLRPPANWPLAHRGRSHENPFCALIAGSKHGCAACLKIQGQISASKANGTASSATCFAGLCDTAVPVRVGQNLLGFLQTGQIALQPPTAEKFQKIAQKVISWGIKTDLRKLEEAYFHSRVLTPTQYAGIVRLLEIFATHLGAVGNRLLIQESMDESPFTRRAKAYVMEHQADPISLEEVSNALHVSIFYFCKLFKKATGLTFTDYLGRVRIERAKSLLLDPNRRISEVAYEVGFGSLTHFNRVFRRLTGSPPTDYRKNFSRSEE